MFGVRYKMKSHSIDDSRIKLYETGCHDKHLYLLRITSVLASSNINALISVSYTHLTLPTNREV